MIGLLCHEHSGSYWKFSGPIGQGTSSFALPTWQKSDTSFWQLEVHYEIAE